MLHAEKFTKGHPKTWWDRRNRTDRTSC